MNDEITQKVRIVHGKLSELDHTQLKVLRSVYTLDHLVKFIQDMPAVLSPDQIEFVEKIVTVHIEADDDFESDEAN